MNAKAHEILDAFYRAPSTPVVASWFEALSDNPNFNLEEIIGLLSTDARVVSDLSRIANAPLFRGMLVPSSLREAILRLGVGHTRSFVLARGMIDRLTRAVIAPIDPSYFWRRSLATGVLCAYFADWVALIDRESSFLAGLMCDAGVLILAWALPTEYAVAAASYGPQSEDWSTLQERPSIGTSHAELSAQALERWHFPTTVAFAVRFHHEDVPPNPREAGGRLAGIMNGAGQIAQILCGRSTGRHVRERRAQALDAAGLPFDVLPNVLEQFEADIDHGGIATALRIDMKSSTAYHEIRQYLI